MASIQPVGVEPSSKPHVPSQPRSHDSSEFASPSAKRTVLLVEDDPLVLRALTRLIQRLGYEVDTAPHGLAALEKIALHRYDVILSDISMPGMDGIQLLRKLRDRDTLVPFVVLTGEPAVATAAQALEYGAFRYLTKPVSLRELEETLHKAVRYHQVARMKARAATLLGNAHVPQDRASLEATFARALDTLWVAYQPIVVYSQRTVLGFEGLLRAREPALPHPGAIIDAAERLEELDILGRTIRRHAAGDMATSPSDQLLFVNLHVRDLADPTLYEPEQPLSRIAPKVVLEITERAALDEIGDARTRIARLREMGFRIAIDDLGAGYSGLASFAQLEPEVVKLDMSLVRGIDENRTKQKVVRSMVALTREMGMLVVVEGVETDGELETLVSLGCDVFQGYRFAKPGPPFPVVRW
ncbi:MAG: EAL domain-containing protein [Polyangiaceae bacterium]